VKKDNNVSEAGIFKSVTKNSLILGLTVVNQYF